MLVEATRRTRANKLKVGEFGKVDDRTIPEFNGHIVMRATEVDEDLDLMIDLTDGVSWLEAESCTFSIRKLSSKE